MRVSVCFVGGWLRSCVFCARSALLLALHVRFPIVHCSLGGSEPAVFDGSYDFTRARHVTRFHIGARGCLDADRLLSNRS